MTKAVQKITLSPSRDIPFNKLVLSQRNVRRTKAGTSIEQLAESIAERTLLQSLNVRAIRDADGQETGMFEVPAGGRRYRALELLVKQKRMAKTQPVPCVVRDGGIAEDDSLAENDERVGLHPLDQFRAFKALFDNGMSEEDIAARHFVSATVVKQRLRLASVSPKLHDAYAADAMTLEQLMAFTVTDDHDRQEQVWENVCQSGNDRPYFIRRMLAENTVAASDRRARFVGLDVYEQAGGVVIRDLFDDEETGYLQDVLLLDKLVAQKLKVETDRIASEGWKWVNAAVSFPYGYTHGLREIDGEPIAISQEEQTALDALEAEYRNLEARYQDEPQYPDAVDQRLGELERAITAIQDRPYRYQATDIACAGVFISLDDEGAVCIERGYVHPKDDEQAEATHLKNGACDRPEQSSSAPRTVITVGAQEAEPEEDDGSIKPLPDRLVMELTAHRTLALQNAVAWHPRVAETMLLHTLCRDTFGSHFTRGCLEVSVRHVHFPAQAPDLNESLAAQQIEERNDAWVKEVPKDDAALWGWIDTLDQARRASLLAHCVAYGINALHEKANATGPISAHGLQHRLAEANRLARAANLDMVEAGWRPTVDNYLGRVSKARILEAVREAKGDASAQLIDHLKKGDMAKEAERLLDGAGWLPEPLRLSDAAAVEAPDVEDEALPEFLDDKEDGANDADDDDQPCLAAAE